MEHSFELLFFKAKLFGTILYTIMCLKTEYFFNLFWRRSHKWYNLCIFSNISSKLTELFLFCLYFNDSLNDFNNSRIKSFSLHHESGSLNKLNASKKNRNKLRKFDSMTFNIKGIFQSSKPCITIIELDETQKVTHFMENLIIL